MISFWRQLRFLLWKGVVVKKRQKIWLAIEMLVPIVLFAIVALIRTHDFNEKHSTCHYASKAFPSAGLAPFVNGWLCFITNKCSVSPVTGDEQRKLGEGVPSSLLIDGIRAFSDELEIIGKDPEGFNKTMQSLAQVIHLLATKNLTESSILELGDDLLHNVDAMKQLGDGPLGKFLLELASFNDVDSLISAIVCGQNSDPTSSFASIFSSSSIRKGVKRDAVSNRRVTRSMSDESKDGEDCYGIPVRDARCNLDGYKFLVQVIPMLQGRILVAPAGPLVDRLMEKLNDPLQYAEFLATLFPQYAEVATALQDAINMCDLPKATTNALTYLRHSGLISNQTLDSLERALQPLFGPSSDPSSIGVVLKGIVEDAIDTFKCVLIDRIVSVEDEQAMQNAAVCLQKSQQYYSGVVLHGVSNSTTDVPIVVTYSIRHLQSMVDGTGGLGDSPTNMRARDDPLVDLKYTTYGYIYLQEAVEQALREMIAEDENGTAVDDIGAYSQQEPYPCYEKDVFDVTMFLSMFVVLSWMVPSALLVKNIVYEKEQRLKELMRIMGLGDSIHFISWALISLVLNTLSVIVISVILKWCYILPSVDFTLLLVFFFLFALASIAQSLLFSTFFTNANIATAFTAVMVFLCFIPFQLSQKGSPWMTMICLLFPQTAMGFGMTVIATGDGDGAARWATIGQLKWDAFSVSLSEVLIALSVDTVLFCIVAWYISAVHPGVHGVSQPFYFFCLPSYWCSRKEEDEQDDCEKVDQSPRSDREEPDPVDAKMTVAIRGLEKIYRNRMKALDGLDLRLYEGQITGLLGHNGAGKTTTMSMLCGLFSPSGGTATIYGRDLRKEMRAVRGTLGFCPQHNVLFDVLTVREQLYFYAALKGVSDENMNNEVAEVIDSIGLGEKTECKSGSLSGGQKRRLCIGIALIGGSRFVILDEPTAGVDVNSRKSIWKLLMKHKKDRTILLSTHHMDEADVLSDRIAILSEGKLLALGSSLFLKSRFGQNPRLTCIKTDRSFNYKQAIDEICNLYEKLPVTHADESDEELTFHLPLSCDSQVLEEFFRLFDDRLADWHLKEYGITAPTLQDIFVSLAPQSDFKLTKVEGGCMNTVMSCFKGGKATIAASEQDKELDGWTTPNVCETAPILRPSKSRQARALLTARAHYTRRSWLVLFFEMVAPILLLLLCELYARHADISDNDPATAATVQTQPPLYIVSSMYDDNSNHYLSLWDQTPLGAAAQLAQSLLDFPGMGPRCLPYGSNETYSSACWEEVEDQGALSTTSLLSDNQDDIAYTVDQRCGATPFQWDCTKDDYPVDELAYQHANTSDYIYDLSFRNLSQFRLITPYSTQGDSHEDFVFTGGLSMGHINPAAPTNEGVEDRKSGWRVMREVLSSQAEVIGLNFSSIPTPKTSVPDFASSITIDSFMERVIGAMDTKESVKLWYNNKRWASLPIYTNILSNAMLRLAHLRRGESLDTFARGIVGVNHPMDAPPPEPGYNQNAVQNVTLFRVVLLVLVLSVVPAGYAVGLVEERVSHSFHLQIVSGLSRKMYWAMSFLFDISLYLLAILIIIVIYLALGVKDFTYTPALLFSFLLMWTLYGLVDVIFVYILQRNFNIAALAFVMISIGTFFVGVVTTMTVVVLEQLNTDTTLATAHDVCYYAFLIVPQYNLGMAIARGSAAYQSVAYEQSYYRGLNRPDLADTVPMPSVLVWNLMGIHAVALSVEILLGLALLIFLEYGSLGFSRRREKKMTEGMLEKAQAEKEDTDVTAEANRVANIDKSSEEYGLVVKELAKAFSSKLVVGGVSFAVEKGECFGLLGLNGAGKTTTFGMMTGRLDIGHGEVRIRGEKVSPRSSDAFRNLGYCPQFDALNMKLTTRENVEFFARIKGIEEKDMKKTVDDLLRSLHLLPYASILTKSLSGGNRRKLSVAVALVAQPPVILLDEPSAGMDPGSHLFLWSVIGKMRRNGRAVVLTSHSMEECEALCTRIAIMDKGRIRCIGSKQYLKNKFGDGFSLTLKFATTQQAEESESFICERLPKAKLMAVHCSAAFYRIPSDQTTVVEILQVVNKVKEHFSVEDFSLSQTTLDEIFQHLSETSSTSKSADIFDISF